MELAQQIASITQKTDALIASAQTVDELEQVRLSTTGKKGELTLLLRSLGSLAPQERPQAGKLINEARTHFEAVFEQKNDEIKAQELAARIQESSIDITLPGLAPTSGSAHIITQIVEEIEELFCNMGYSIEEGPYVETDYYNFTSLNVPLEHPSRSSRDTFYVVDPLNPQAGANLISNVLLRTQTSPVQMRTMETQKPPIYMLSPGKVFRPDTADASHLPQFTQIEGLVIDKGISFANLKGTLDYFTKAIFGPTRKTRYRPHFFPFTEPSAEVDVSCGVCGGKGCKFCGGEGWIEILGCGMVDVAVLENAGIDPDIYSGFAFGIGAERVACLRYDLDDIRTLVTNDMRFLRQF